MSASSRWRRYLPLGLLFGSWLVGAALAQPIAADHAPGWTEAAIRGSRVVHVDPSTLPSRPRWRADPTKLIVVVQANDKHLSLIDGERFEVLHRLPLRGDALGAPRFSPEGRFAYVATRDGWIGRHDLWNLTAVAEVRIGLALQHFAISGDGRWLVAANASSRTLALFDAQLNLVKQWAVGNREGTAASRVAAVVDATTRQSFVVALQDLPELWEISYNPKAEDFYDGLVHDFRMGEGVPTRGFLNPRRHFIPVPLTQLLFEPTLTQVAGLGQATDGATSVDLINLDARRRVGSMRLAGRPVMDAAALFESMGSPVLGVPNRDRAELDVIDLRTWQRLKSVTLPGPAAFVRSHAHSRVTWVYSNIDGQGALTAIDRDTLKPLAPFRGDGVSAVAFSPDGRHLWISQGGAEGALIVRDAQTFEEIKRLPLRAPNGAFNAAR